MDPCSTPEVTFVQDDVMPSTSTRVCHFCKYVIKTILKNIFNTNYSQFSQYKKWFVILSIASVQKQTKATCESLFHGRVPFPY